MFDLKSPCKTCPFRIGQGHLFSLRTSRLVEIERAPAFQCHSTIDYAAMEGDEKVSKPSGPQQCAGLMTVLHREGRPNQIMQVAERLGELDCSKLDPRGTVYLTWSDVLRAHLQGVEP